MNKEQRLFAGLVAGALVLTSASASLAQKKQTAIEEQQVTFFQREIQAPDGQRLPDKTVVFISSEMNFDGKLVKGAPYSAQAITESTQTFSDGNRIVNRSTAALYRDSEGRTRREQSLRAIGPFPTEGEAPTTIFIIDPVAGVSYSLDPRTHEAHKMPPMRFQFMLDDKKAAGERKVTAAPDGQTRTRTERIEIQPDVMMGGAMAALPRSTNPGAGVVMEWHGTADGKGKEEALGKQNIEGVEAEGTRNTVTIPAGEIGNERPIEIVSERWYSPELQTVVMTRHSDPRFGETVYRLTNINRSEPSKTLFEVPGDYTIKPIGGPMTGPMGGVAVPFEMGGGETSLMRTRAINGGVLNGKATSLPQPEYPAVARQAHASGAVKVEVTIDEDGNVISAKAISGHPLLQVSAVAAARQAKFSPTRLEGKPVQVSGTVVYEFVAQ